MYPCKKTEVCSVIVSKMGEIVVGQNLIRNPNVDKCPRLPGEGYRKCKAICHQESHAEVDAINRAKERGIDLKNAKLYLINKDNCCIICKDMCNEEQIQVIIVNKLEEK